MYSVYREEHPNSAKSVDSMEGEIFLLEVWKIGGSGTLTADHVKNLKLDKAQLKLKVQGENRMIAVVNGSADEAASVIMRIPREEDLQLDIRCTPLLGYETFCKQSLGVRDGEIDKKVEAAPPFQSGAEMYWVELNIGYAGREIEKLIDCWHAEAVVALNLIHGGQLPLCLFKSVFMRQIQLFVQMEASELDKLLFNLPLMRGLGDQITTTTKRVSLQ